MCQETTTAFDFQLQGKENEAMRITPDTFEEAVIALMEGGLTIRQAFARARKIYPDIYLADRAVTKVFSENSWFMVVREAKSKAVRENIPLLEAFKRVYGDNPQLVKGLLGRDFL